MNLEHSIYISRTYLFLSLADLEALLPQNVYLGMSMLEIADRSVPGQTEKCVVLSHKNQTCAATSPNSLEMYFRTGWWYLRTDSGLLSGQKIEKISSLPFGALFTFLVGPLYLPSRVGP